MKIFNGLLTYKSYNHEFNIGDYIQSLAARQFFEEGIDLFLNREYLNLYQGDPVRIILNGWFLHETQNWPPSDAIIPLIISFHINSLSYKHLFSSKSFSFFKKWEPIGCRDKKTEEILKNHGISAYFSGCLILTLGDKYFTSKTKDTIYFVGPYFEVSRKLFRLLQYSFVFIFNLGFIIELSEKIYSRLNVKSIIKSSAFYCDYSKSFDKEILRKLKFIHHILNDSQFESESERFKYAEKLVKMYADARFIVTSRIHCALPCLGLETPVIYVENINQKETSFCRLDGIRELLNIITYDHGQMTIKFKLWRKILIGYKISNRDDYKKYRDSLREKCKNFVKM